MKVSEKESDLQKRTDILDVQELALCKRETLFIKRENSVSSKEKSNDDERDILIRHKSSLNARESSLDERAQEIENSAEAERNRLQRIHDDLINRTDIINKAKSHVDFLKNRMTEIFMKMPLNESMKKRLNCVCERCRQDSYD